MQIIEFLPLLLKGAIITGELVILGFALSLVFAFLAGLARLSRHWWLRWAVTVYIETFRGTSCLVQLYWIFFVLPFFGIMLKPMTAGVLTLGLNVGAFSAEIIRGAILAVPRTQIEACIALNFSPWQRFRVVVLPQALIHMLPPLGNQIVDTIKLSSLISLITVHDLTFISRVFQSNTGQTIAPFAFILVIYLIYASCAIWGVRWLEKRQKWAIAAKQMKI